jgi:hypothetical protein
VNAKSNQTLTNVSDSDATVRRGLASRISQIGSFRADRTLSHRVMTAKSNQTVTNVSDPGGTVRRGLALIRKGDLAKELSVSLRTIDNWVRQKRIPVHRFSSRLIRYDLRRVQNALDKYEVREIGRRLE